MTDRGQSGLPWDFRTSDNLEKIASCESEEAIQKIRHSDEQICPDFAGARQLAYSRSGKAAQNERVMHLRLEQVVFRNDVPRNSGA